MDTYSHFTIRSGSNSMAKLRKKADFKEQFWRINATKCIDKGISRKNEAIRSEGSTQIWEDCSKS